MRAEEASRKVTFTVLEDGIYLPTMNAVLPEGSYPGRITSRDGKITDVSIHLDQAAPNAIGYRGDRLSLQWSIVQDYRSGLIREDGE